jgi:Major Facilitator Superfamily
MVAVPLSKLSWSIVVPCSPQISAWAPLVMNPALVKLALVIVVGSLAAILDLTIVNVAIDTLQRRLHTSVSTIQWVSTGYVLASAMTIPVSGWAFERFGARRSWIASLIIFVAGSARQHSPRRRHRDGTASSSGLAWESTLSHSQISPVVEPARPLPFASSTPACPNPSSSTASTSESGPRSRSSQSSHCVGAGQSANGCCRTPY